MTAQPDDVDELSARITELYGDAQRCAEVVGLVYVTGNEPGITRLRRGRGFAYRDARGRPVNPRVKERIVALAVPPAWRDVWISADEAGHITAVGIDDRGRKQYLYHERWRALRDLLNFYRLIEFGEHLPRVRREVERQLARRTFDHERVVAAMVRIVDSSAIRIGSEVYAEENETFGLSTLNRRHATVSRAGVTFAFPAKSGRRAEIVVRDRAVARVVERLAGQRRRRLFTVDGRPVDAAEVNDWLREIAGAHVTAKDFRTWRGTVAAFAVLERAPDDATPERWTLAAVDAAAEVLGNTRAVARAHYVHPHVLSTFADGTFATYRSPADARRHRGLTTVEARLLGFLGRTLESEFDRARAGLDAT